VAPSYPAIAENLLAHCRKYRHGVEDLKSLQAEVWSAASQVSIPEERALREFLQQAEGRLDIIQFTVDEAEVERASLETVEAIEGRLSAYLAEPDAPPP
jgi:hypothetical protein